MTTDDQHLIEECRAGRTEAFGRLVERYQDRLFHSLRSMLRSAEDARDVAQDAFVQAFQKLGTFRSESAFYSWLFRIAVNRAISHRRRRRQPASLEALREQSGVEPRDPRSDLGAEDSAEASEHQELVRRAIDQLDDEFRDVLVLREMEGLAYHEIAALLEIPIGTVRSRIHRARSELRERLRPWLAGD